jgi:ribosomal protein L6P/L9E
MISDLKLLEKACDSKKLKDSELEFDVIDPPRSVIVSSDDDKLTVKGVTDFLTKKKLETLKVRTTEEGSISVKFKSPEGSEAHNLSLADSVVFVLLYL